VRELFEEMGVSGVELTEVGYHYKEDSVEPKGWKAFNRLYIGKHDGEVHPHSQEVAEVKWLLPTEIETWMDDKPEEFTKGCIRTFKLVRKLL
jgi:ADP-ribose pyrophosphatase YjhB (NUDIX family)